MVTQEKFIAKAKATHPDAGYCYDKVAYVDSYTQVTITCPVHGDFEQTPNSHLVGRGCPPCGWESRAASNTYTQDEFIAKAKAQHPLAGYGYDKFVYVDARTAGTITCPVHGDFTQKPSSHLNGNGCQTCSGRISRISTAWLDDLGITIREHLIWIPGRSRPLAADGYDPKTNTVYEFLGDYFHGNPAVYDPDAWISKSQRVTYGQRHAQLMSKLADLRSAGYNVVTIWERDFRALNEGRIYPHDPTRSRGPRQSKASGRPPRPPRNSQSDLFG